MRHDDCASRGRLEPGDVILDVRQFPSSRSVIHFNPKAWRAWLSTRARRAVKSSIPRQGTLREPGLCVWIARKPEAFRHNVQQETRQKDLRNKLPETSSQSHMLRGSMGPDLPTTRLRSNFASDRGQPTVARLSTHMTARSTSINRSPCKTLQAWQFLEDSHISAPHRRLGIALVGRPLRAAG